MLTARGGEEVYRILRLRRKHSACGAECVKLKPGSVLTEEIVREVDGRATRVQEEVCFLSLSPVVGRGVLDFLANMSKQNIKLRLETK